MSYICGRSLLLSINFVFFFKQKTAYGMRISDWSSDVCSSDLLATALHGSGPAYIYLVIEAMIDAAVRLGMKRPDASALVLATVAGSAHYAIETEIGRASCRERVCKYV